MQGLYSMSVEQTLSKSKAIITETRFLRTKFMFQP